MAQRYDQWLLDRLQSDDEDELAIAIVQQAIADILDDEGHKQASRPAKKKKHIHRNRAAAHQQILQDYFTPGATYEDLFRRRYRMSRQLFDRICTEVTQHDSYFQQKCDAAGRPGLSPVQKITAALRMMTKGCSADTCDEYIRIGETTTLESLRRFAIAIIEIFSKRYLRTPTAEDVKKHLNINAARGFPGMFGSLDCTHWTWKNCPVAWLGHYQDRKGLRSIVMEAVSTQDLWIWHAFIGIPGSNNDINVLDRSPLLPEWFKGPAKEAEYQINGVNYQGSYLLADGIYPDSTLFVKTFSNPQSAKLKHFAKQQEAVRKDVERCFGVLKSRFSILNGAGRLWDIEVMKNIWTSAVIMHNMILEDERKDERIECGADIENGGDDADEDGTDREDGGDDEDEDGTDREDDDDDEEDKVEAFRAWREQIADAASVTKLRSDLVDHLWNRQSDAIN